MSSVEEQVRGIIAEQLGLKADEIKNDARSWTTWARTSLDTVELVMALEEEFETEIPDEEAEKITTVQQANRLYQCETKRRLICCVRSHSSAPSL
jgi:acyl carrier protein